MYTEEVNKIALSSNNDKRIPTFDKVTTYPYGTNAFMVCENEMLLKKKKIENKKNNLSIVMENISDNKSQEQKLRNGAQAIRSSLYIVRSELQEHKNEAQAIRSSTI